MLPGRLYAAGHFTGYGLRKLLRFSGLGLIQGSDKQWNYSIDSPLSTRWSKGYYTTPYNGCMILRRLEAARKREGTCFSRLKEGPHNPHRTTDM